EPFGVPLAVPMAGVAAVENVPQLVDQNVVEIEVANRFLGPNQLPLPAIDFPRGPVHGRFDLLSRLWRLAERLDERLFDRIEIDGATPLHAIAGRAALLLRHLAELHHFERLD